MKKINSIDYGWKIICLGLGIGVLIPLVLYIVNIQLRSQAIRLLISGCMGIGTLIIVGFCIYLGIELCQDKKIGKYYDSHRKDKIKIGKDYYECAACGNRKVKAQDKSCTICGVVFEAANKTVSEIVSGTAKDKSRV